MSRDIVSHKPASWLPHVFIAWVALLVALGADNPARDSARVQYQKAVQLLVDNGWFELELTGGRRTVVLTDAAAAHQQAGDLIASVKGLRDDEATLQEHMLQGDLWTFAGEREVRGAKVTGFEIDPRSAWLFRNPDSWRGEMTYSRPPTSSAIPLVNTRGSRTLNFVGDANIAALRGAGNIPTIVAGNNGAVSSTSSAFEFSCDDRIVALAHRVGDEVVINLNTRLKETPCAVYVGGRPLGSSEYCNDRNIPEDQCGFSAIKLGDRLSFTRTGNDGSRILLAEYQRQREPSARMVMRRDARDNKVVEDLEFERLVNSFASDIAEEVRGCDSARSGIDLDCDDTIPLAIDYAIQQDAIAALEPTKRASRGRSAVVVMNALTGEIAGMAGTFDPELQRDCLHPAMCRFPIGSVAKPIFATAMIAASENAELAGLVVDVKPGDNASILGLELGSTARNLNGRGSASGAGVDLETFVRFSDNYYIAAMAVLASPVSNGVTCGLPPGESYLLGGQRRSARLQSAFETSRCKPIDANGMVPPFRPAWAQSLQEIFDLNPYTRVSLPSDICSDDAYFGDRSYDATPWRALFKSSSDRCAIAKSGLVREHFAIDQQLNFRLETIPLLLGNGEGRFTAVKLAESYSRLATGRKIQSSLIALQRDQRGRARRFSNTENVARIAVSRGMARLIEGTAQGTRFPAAVQKLRERLGPTYRLGVFSKTGTIGLEPAFASGCSGVSEEDCEGKAFVATIAVYRDPNGRLETLGATGLVADATAEPICAVTIVGNLPQWNGPGGNRAADMVAEILDGTVADELARTDGVFCGR